MGATAVARTNPFMNMLMVWASVVVARDWITQDTGRLRGGARRLFLCVVVAIVMMVNVLAPQTAAFTITSVTTLAVMTQPVLPVFAVLAGLGMACLLTMDASFALQSFALPQLWTGLFASLVGTGLPDLRGRLIAALRGSLGRVPVVGTSWLSALANLLVAPWRRCSDGVVTSLFLTGSASNVLAACLASGSFGIPGLGVMEWTRTALAPVTAVLLLRPLLVSTLDRLGLADVEDLREPCDEGKLKPGPVAVDELLGVLLVCGCPYLLARGVVVEPLVAALLACTVLALRGRISTTDLSGSLFQEVLLIASLAALNSGAFVGYGGFASLLTEFLAAIPGVPYLLHPWLLVAGYLYLRRYFQDGTLQVAALFPTFLAALGGNARDVLVLAFATSIGRRDQSERLYASRLALVFIFMVVAGYPIVA